MDSFASTLIYSLIVTLFGMGIVFIVLVVLQYILEGMRIIFYRDKKVKKAAPQAEEVQVPAVSAAAPAVEAAEDEELIAVISAAIAASLGGKSNIVVRNIRRVNDMTPVWAKAGRNEQMSSRF